MPSSNDFKGRVGLERLLNALRYSWAGLRHAARSEAAFREELAAAAVLAPASLALPVSRVEHLLLVLALLFILLVELVNTAIEAVVDRVSLELHPLAGTAKDLGSAAVLTSLVMGGLCWAVIAGPVAYRWIAGPGH
jgi:diacylglycerol kinase (ATP)